MHYLFHSKVLRLIDGDSLEAEVLVYPPRKLRFNGPIRLWGINTPETYNRPKGMTDAQWEIEKIAGKAATEHLRSLLDGKDVSMKIMEESEKYGRELSILFVDDEREKEGFWGSVNAQMVLDKYAKLIISGQRNIAQEREMDENRDAALTRAARTRGLENARITGTIDASEATE